MPVAMDEYNPENWADWKADAFHEHLKKSTDAQSIEKGNPDQSLTEYRFEVSPIVLGEQQLPESMPALPRRAIEVTLQTTSTARGTETAERFNRLRELADDDWGLGLHHHAVDWWAHVCEAAESPIDVVNDWHQTEDWLRDELAARGIELNAELPRSLHQQGLQTVAFGLRRWRQFAVSRGADPALLFDEEDIIDTVEHLIDEKTGEHASSVDNESALLELLGDAAAVTGDDGATQPYVARGEQYALLNVETSEPTELRLHLKSTLRQLSKFSRDYGLDATLYQKSDYYRWFKSAAENPDSVVLDASRKTHLGNSQKRCVSIDFEQLTDELDVHPDDLLPEHIDIGDGDGESDAGSDDDDETRYQQTPSAETQPIGDIDADEQVVASAIGTVEMRKYDGLGGGDGRPHFTAHLVDEAGDAELVIWDEQDMPEIYDGGSIGPDALLVKNAKPDTYDGELQLIVQSDTVVQPAQVGAGETGLPDTDGSERLASTDGGAAQADAEPETPADAPTNPGDSDDDDARSDTADGVETDSDDDTVDGDAGDSSDADAGSPPAADDETVREDIDKAVIQETTLRSSDDPAYRDAVTEAVAAELGVDVETVDGRIKKLLQQSRGIYDPFGDGDRLSDI
jgi:hypothetical protein